jgi:hypothetical protein
MTDRVEGGLPELRQRRSCLLCNQERPCNWACLGTDSLLAGSVWISDVMLADFERAEEKAPAVGFVIKNIADSF